MMQILEEKCEVQWKNSTQDHQVGHISSGRIRHGQAQLEPSDHPTPGKRKKNVGNVTNVSRKKVTWDQFLRHLHPRASPNQVWARNIPQRYCDAIHRKDAQTKYCPWLTDASTKLVRGIWDPMHQTIFVHPRGLFQRYDKSLLNSLSTAM